MAKTAYVNHFGQKPLTRFTDYLDAIQVKLITAPDLSVVAPALSEVLGATWGDSPGARMSPAEAVEHVTKGKALWQCLEMLDGFVFRFEGVTRTFTHQLVRARVGVTFAQQCSGDADWRHHDVVVPRWRPPVKFGGFGRWRLHMLEAKGIYSRELDDRRISLQEARFLIPHGWATFIYMKCNLSMLFQLFPKRTCTMNQSMEMVVAMEKMVDAVERWDSRVGAALRSTRKCTHGKCFHYLVYGVDGECTQLWKPDVDHAGMEVPGQEYVYDATHREMSCDGEKIPDSYYHGYDAVGQREWEDLRKEYGCEVQIPASAVDHSAGVDPAE